MANQPKTSEIIKVDEHTIVGSGLVGGKHIAETLGQQPNQPLIVETRVGSKDKRFVVDENGQLRELK